MWVQTVIYGRSFKLNGWLCIVDSYLIAWFNQGMVMQWRSYGYPLKNKTKIIMCQKDFKYKYLSLIVRNIQCNGSTTYIFLDEINEQNIIMTSFVFFFNLR